MHGQQELPKYLKYYSSLEVRVQGDNIDPYVDGYHDSTDYKMWQDTLPHKKVTQDHRRPQ